MTLSATAGPFIVFGNEATPPGTVPRGGQLNPDAGPSLFYAGAGILDPRPAYTYYSGQSPDSPTVLGWQSTDIIAVDAAPEALLPNNIALSQSIATVTTITLTAGAGVTAADTFRNAVTGALVTAFRIGPKPVGLSAGSSSYADIWDPATVFSRAVSITATAAVSMAGITFAVVGYDIYGYPQTETITGPGASLTVNGKKTWKWITSVTASATVATATVSVGTADIFGFPVRAASLPYVSVYWNNTLQTTNIIVADATTPTGLTGDVRGTFGALALSPASNGTIRLVVFITIPVAGMAVTTNAALVTGMFGVTPG